jgi:RNA polymerase sigma-70 factor (ECF subfamily)
VNAELDAGWRAGKDAWPGVDVTALEYAAYLAEQDAAGDVPPASRNGRDLYLACACARSDEAAVAAFDAAYLREIERSVRRVPSFNLSFEELRQMVHQKLFVAEPGARPKITEYSGRGELRTWVRIVATRMALTAATRGSREVPVEMATLAHLVGGSDDPEVAYLKRMYTGEFRAAFEAAFATISPRDRNLLRYAFVEGLTIDGIGALYKVHRATAARWIVKAHGELGAKVKEGLLARLGVDAAEYESILRLLQSQIDLTLERFLEAESSRPSTR